MGSRPWTTDDEKWLVENYGTHTLQESADILGRTLHAVQVKASEMRRMGVSISRCVTAYHDEVYEEDIIEIPDGDCDGYVLEVSNDLKLIAKFFPKTRERVMDICNKYGRGYHYKIVAINNNNENE